MPYSYDPRTGRYRNERGKFVGRGEILRALDEEINRTRTRLQGIARLLASDRITTDEFQKRMGEAIKSASIRTAALGAGGTKGLTNAHYGTIGASLRNQYKYLRKFGQDLAEGKLSGPRAIARAAMYADAVKVTFHQAEKLTRRAGGANEAKRSLDPSVKKHCSDCPGLSTNGKWVPIDQVVLPTFGCECGQHCHCFVTYRRRI